MLDKDFHENDITEMETSSQDINHTEEVIILGRDFLIQNHITA